MCTSLRGIIDLHVHSAPDIRERAYDDIDLMNAGVRVGARAIVIKSHHGTTMNRAYLVNRVNEMFNGLHAGNKFEMFGSITLNRVIGGLNSAAVETGLKMGAKIVHMPTVSAVNHLEKYGKSPVGGIVCVEKGKLTPALKDILKVIKDYDVALATGHLAPTEIFTLMDEACGMGIDKLIVTHPEFWVVGMPLEDQIRVTRDYGAVLERCYAQPMGGGVYKSNLKENLEAIKEIGYKNILISTDGGQVENPHWELAMKEYLEYLRANGIENDAIHSMTRTTPARLLNIN